jgi:hypothetical protein
MCVSERKSRAKNTRLRRRISSNTVHFPLHSATVQLGCSSPASSIIPHYYCDYRARAVLLQHTRIHIDTHERERERETKECTYVTAFRTKPTITRQESQTCVKRRFLFIYLSSYLNSFLSFFNYSIAKYVSKLIASHEHVNR